MIACISPTATPETHQHGTDAATAIQVSDESKSIHLLGKVTRKAVVTPIIEATSTLKPASTKFPTPSHPPPPPHQNDDEIIENEDDEGFAYAEDDL